MIKRKVIRKNGVSNVETPAPQPVAAAVPPQRRTTQPVTPAPQPVQVVVTGGKFRRLKDNGVAKLKRFERELCGSDRDLIIRWWNQNQRLVPKGDPICADLAGGMTTISAMQVAGYLSYLCRLGQWTEIARQERLSRNLERGAFSVMPVYSRALLDAIAANWERERQDEALRAQAHAELRAARAAGRHLRIKSGDGVRSVIEPATTTVRATAVQTTMVLPSVPVAEPTAETFDVKWM
jgi:hypothetical protein